MCVRVWLRARSLHTLRHKVRRTHQWSMCACSAALRSIHVAAANCMTTSLLPIAICLLCANLSQHIRVWLCPHLTSGGEQEDSGRDTREEREGGENKGSNKDCSPRGEAARERKREVNGSLSEGKDEIYAHTGILEALPAQVITTHLPPPGSQSQSVVSFKDGNTKTVLYENRANRHSCSLCVARSDLEEGFLNMIAEKTKQVLTPGSCREVVGCRAG